MLDLESLTAINIEQIVTRTDLILLRGRGHSARSRRSFDFSAAAAAAVAVSRAREAVVARDPASPTLIMRAARPTSMLRAALVAASVTWLAVAALCLLL